MVVSRSLGLLCLAISAIPSARAAGNGPVKFNRDIRPIMSDTCFRCHGPDKRSRMAGMRLDLREEALKPRKSGLAPIAPSDPDRSAIIQRIFAADPRKIMPPQNVHKELTAAQKETVRRWVAEGASYEGHWAYQPVKRPLVPEVAPASRNPIDAFIRERLAAEKLHPSPEADRRTLLRRVTLDLTGIPPTGEEYDTFRQDTAPDAYDKVVNRLLDSPRYAEMRSMLWLDAVRYGDSSGFHGDNLWPVWPYRDYVLRAFRDNMPFDRFTREQIAGDLLPDGAIDQKVASAYNRLNRASAEGGIQFKEYLAKYGADRVRTTSTTWLGSTMGCAECHDHKFDPFSSRDFYAMKAFFADIKETGLIPDRGPKAWGSKLYLPTAEQKAKLEELTRAVETGRAALKERVEQLRDERLLWEERILAAHAAGRLAWRYQRPLTAQAANGAKLTIYNEEPLDFNFYLNGSLASERKPGGGLIAASGPNPDNETYTVTMKPGAGSWTGLGIEIQQDESLPGTRLGRGADRFVLSEVEALLTEASGAVKPLPMVLANTTGFGEPGDMPPLNAIDGNPKTGWAVSFGEHRNAFLAVRFGGRVATAEGSTLTVKLRQDSDYRRATIGRFRIALSAGEYSWPETGDSGSKRKAAPKQDVATLNVAVDRGVPPDALQALETEEAERTDDQKALVAQHFAWSSPRLQDDIVRLAQMEGRLTELQARIPRVLYTERQRPRITRILPRANWMDETNEIVEPAIPGFLGKLETGGRRANRLDLANWIVSPSNPLTARVFVNRLWRQFFGTGLSKVMEDIGSQGESPTHPELVDWLASEFMQPTVDAAGAHAWDVKHMIRLIVLSQTYRQASTSTPELEERDPDNRLLARQSRFRVDAEVVHDIALSVSGLLANRFGGPSVHPYQPEGYLAAMNFPKREYSASHGDDLYRRALYTEWQRTFLHPTLAAFDAPSREECTVNRVNSNTPLQSLVLLNDPIFVEAARAFAQTVLASGGKSFDDRLARAFERALNRPPRKEEQKVLSALYKKALAHFRTSEAGTSEFLSIGEAPLPAAVDRTELAAMTTVTRAILNLHETITRN